MGLQSDSGFKPQAYHICANAFKDDTNGAVKTADKWADHFSYLKKSFSVIRKLQEQFSFRWDDGLKIMTTSDDVWDAYIADQLPLYDEILFLVDGIVATGAGAFHAGMAAAGLAQPQVPPIPDCSQAPAVSQQSQAVIQNDEEEEAGNTSIETPINSDLTPSSPVCTPTATSSSRKRPTSSSTPSSPSSPRSCCIHNAEAASEIAMALHDIAKYLNTMGSPEVCSHAMQMMEEDEGFSSDEELLVMRLFAKDISVAQTYIASTKKSCRITFIHAILEDTEL
ncbi:hypothetical protein DFH08DRAFT_813149 [Mycena albidolilacea]|uniref:Myb/SANT-like domain-containing protein n=1 Tax=Mycena albidolilacea TaxID=1033008 RepID=A0AAD6ZT03_9AGAR|nr:hypothetical protein DFH08DRAFT_813149 [Mycena albidolilacea]